MKIRDEVLVMGTIADEKEGYNGAWDYFVVFEDAGSQWLPAGAIRPLQQPAPVWRDGAVEKPKVGATFWCILKSRLDDPVVYLITPNGHELIGTSYNDILWLPADEFPMPAMPEVVIEVCPFEESDCRVEHQMDGLWQIHCNACAYRTPRYPTEAEAIAAHNRVARKATA